MIRNSDIEIIAKHYGYEHQKRMLVEELAELIQAVMKVDRNDGGMDDAVIRMNNMIEEIADVEIMIAQIKCLLLIDTDYQIDKKIDRQLERMKYERNMHK